MDRFFASHRNRSHRGMNPGCRLDISSGPDPVREAVGPSSEEWKPATPAIFHRSMILFKQEQGLFTLPHMAFAL